MAKAPHLYATKPEDLEKIEGADLVLYHGLHFEGKMVDVLSKKGVAITSTFSIDKLETMDEDGEEIRDPHFWFNVGLYKEACENVAKELINLLPGDKDYIEDKLTAYTGELDSMSGTVAFVAMVSYMALLLFAKEGAFTKAIRPSKDKRTLVYDALLVHLGGHTEKARFSPENNVDEIIHHINWEPAKLNKVTSRMQMKGYIMIVDNYYLLTEKGKKRYQALKSLLPSS